MSDYPLVRELLLPAATAMVGAFAGARFAFRNQEKLRKIQETTERITAVNLAIVATSSAWNALIQFQRDHIEPVRSSPAPWFVMPVPAMNPPEIDFPVEGLSFLLGTQYADMYAEYLLEKERYRTVIGYMRMRSNLVLETLHPKMEQLKLSQKMGLELRYLPKVEENLGPSFTIKLKNITDGIIQHVDKNIESLENFSHKFSEAMKKDFPKEKIVPVKFEK